MVFEGDKDEDNWRLVTWNSNLVCNLPNQQLIQIHF